MKTLLLAISITWFAHCELIAQTTFEIGPSQSMIMTGKGPGQDATINPYLGQECYAIVKNIGKLPFSIRIQQKGKIIEEISILKGEEKKVKLLKDYELYFDPTSKGKTKGSIEYEKIGSSISPWDYPLYPNKMKAD